MQAITVLAFTTYSYYWEFKNTWLACINSGPWSHDSNDGCDHDGCSLIKKNWYFPSLSSLSNVQCHVHLHTICSSTSVLSPNSAYSDGVGGEVRPHRLSMSRHTSNSYSSLEQYAVSTSSIDSGNVSMSSSGSRSRRHKRGVLVAYCAESYYNNNYIIICTCS